MGDECAHLKRPAEDMFEPFHGVHCAFRQRTFQSTFQASVAAWSPTPDQEVSSETFCSIDAVIDESSQHLKRTADEMMEAMNSFHQIDGGDSDSVVTI
jgi:hypothetical protein